MIFEAFWGSHRTRQNAHHEHGPFRKLASEVHLGPSTLFLEVGGYRKTSNLRSGPPMVLMILAPVAACIISIIGVPFRQFGEIRLQSFIRLASGGVKLKMTPSGPDSWVLGPEPWVWADAVTFGEHPSKTIKNDLI